jgi:hypothetical protein
MLKAVGSFYWQNNINGLCQKLGIRNDSTAEQYFRGLTQISNGMNMISPELIAKLIDEDTQPIRSQEVVVTGWTDEDRIESDLNQLMKLLEKAKTSKPATETTRQMAVMYTHVEEAYIRFQHWKSTNKK